MARLYSISSSGEHLHPNRESHQCSAGEARCRFGRRRRSSECQLRHVRDPLFRHQYRGMWQQHRFPSQLYGATYTLLAHILPKQGIAGRFAESDHPDAVEKLIDENTRAVFCESVGNPAGNVADIEGLARVAHKHGVPLIVDNTVATPILLRPIEYGADVVVHSMTKFMGGHGTTLGGMIVDSGKFPWREYPERFYMLNQPEPSYHDVVYTEHFGDAAYVARCRTVCQRNTGATMSPFNGFLLLQGIETMALRVERHVENARKVAEFLRDHKLRAMGQLRGIPGQPFYPMANKYLGTHAFAPDLRSKRRLRGQPEMFRCAALVQAHGQYGRCQILACHPASTTHRQLSPEEQAKVGVTPEMIRLSVGIEHIDDIIADLAQALDGGLHRRMEVSSARNLGECHR